MESRALWTRAAHEPDAPGRRSAPRCALGSCSIVNFPKDVKDLFHGSVLELFPTALEGFSEFDSRILHLFVRFVGTSNEKEMLALGKPLVSVRVIQPKPKEAHYTTVTPILVMRHRARSRMNLRFGTLPDKNIRPAGGAGQLQPAPLSRSARRTRLRLRIEAVRETAAIDVEGFEDLDESPRIDAPVESPTDDI